MLESTCDVLIIGAGPAGTVGAGILNKKGWNVRIVEKEIFPRFVIGESLLPRTMEHLEDAGLLDALKNQNFEKKYGARFIKDGETCLFDFAEQHTKGWTWTWQVTRADFDKVMADEVEKKGVEVSYQAAVVDVTFYEGPSSETLLQYDDGQQELIKAKFIIDASGNGRVLPRLLDLTLPSALAPKSAFFTHVLDNKRPEVPEGTQITFVILEQKLWLWVIPFSNGVTSLGFAGDPSYFSQYANKDENDFYELLKKVNTCHYHERFASSKQVMHPVFVNAYASSVKQLYGEGYVLAGNSAEFLDPVFSSGVAFATESASRAAGLIDRQLRGEKPDWEKEYAAHMREGVNTFRSYVEGWYNGDLQNIFFADNVNAEFKRMICSVLAGYVWDKTNPFVRKHNTILKTLSDVIDISE